MKQSESLSVGGEAIVVQFTLYVALVITPGAYHNQNIIMFKQDRVLFNFTKAVQ